MGRGISFQQMIMTTFFVQDKFYYQVEDLPCWYAWEIDWEKFENPKKLLFFSVHRKSTWPKKIISEKRVIFCVDINFPRFKTYTRKLYFSLWKEIALKTALPL